ncbi:Interferon regulatory factor 8 [Portunus trituberculatus]|uniref:Interferon regulatory factor 8 n=1 Tax=Portunus trituberculatus TaxID=210409 RepID=A0A5B7D5V7_PORTR|nr:Interferon regulatory factor 8 [Portunus trituberculatus]
MSPSAVTADTPMDLSTKTRRKLRLEEFLRQNLDQAPATRVIQWVNRDKGVFRILWTHQSSGAFTQQDAALFRYWALARGKPATQSSVELKQSLRMALNKSPSVDRLSIANDEYRYFRFTDWENRKKNSGVKNMRGQQENTRKRSPPPGHPPPLVPITKKTSSSSPLWSSTDHLALMGREKSFIPYNEEVLRKLLGAYPRPSQLESQPGEQQADALRAHSHLTEQSLLTHMSSQHHAHMSQLMDDNTQEFSLAPGPYMDQATLDCRTREKALREPVSSSYILPDHMKYLPNPHSPQAYSEPLHAVPSYKESLTRQDMEGPLSLYGDNPFYSKSFHHYDYRSAVPTSTTHLFRVPEALDSRLLATQY